MDGVTDATMRHITAKYGRPAVMMTEFTSVEWMVRHPLQPLRDLYYTPIQRPIIAQLYGSTPEAFRTCAVLVCALGFDGVDINMGCPSHSVTGHGAGAALIKTPELAKQIIQATRQGVRDWVEGMDVDDLGFKGKFVRAIKALPNYVGDRAVRTAVPVSVKTRIGYDRVDTYNWISTLLEAGCDNISIHGRTLAQKYSGAADWDEIAKAVDLARSTETTILGNGDIKRPQEIKSRLEQVGVDGVLIGRAALGNPWFFEQYRALENGAQVIEPIHIIERMRVALEHVRYFEYLNETVFKDDPFQFVNLRKHLGWYVRDVRDASTLRQKLFQTNSLEHVENLFQEFMAGQPVTQDAILRYAL